MSEPLDSTVAAVLPPNMSRQQAAVLLANGVCEAYAAYNNGANRQPQLTGYNAFNPIWVYEFDPNVFPWSMTAPRAQAAAAALAKADPPVPREPAAYASRADGTPAPCTGPTPMGSR